MDPSGIPAFVMMWLVVNVGALLVLGVMSYVSSVLALTLLAALDKWMYAREHKHELDSGAEIPEAPEVQLKTSRAVTALRDGSAVFCSAPNHTAEPTSPSQGDLS
jgi:hypothetical protein